MSEEHNNVEESLRSVDPFRNARRDSQLKNQIFQEITMTNNQGQDENSQLDLLQRAAENEKKPNKLVRPLVAMSTAAAVVTVAVLGFSLASSPSASAQMLEVAQNSVDADSGEIIVSAQLEATAADDADLEPEIVSELGLIEGTIEFDFAGEDYSFEAEIDDGDDGFSPQARFVDGDLYVSESGDSWLDVGAEESGLFAELASDYVPGVQNFNSEALEQLILLTDDISVTESDGVTTYSGTVATADILALGADELPAAVMPFRLADQEKVPLPIDLEVEMASINDEIQVMTVSVVEHEIDGVVVSGSVTTDYSGVGEPQEIVAPPADSILTP